MHTVVELIQNPTIEERVTILENQVVEIEEDVTGLDEDVNDLGVDLTELEGDVNFLFDEQIIQDERLFSLEQTVFAIDEEVEGKCAPTNQCSAAFQPYSLNPK